MDAPRLHVEIDSPQGDGAVREGLLDALEAQEGRGHGTLFLGSEVGLEKPYHCGSHFETSALEMAGVS